MIANFSWVIPDRLAGFGVLAMPTSRDLEALRAEGVGAMVSLTETALDAELAIQAGLQHFHLPVPDMQAPSLGEIRQFIEFVNQARRSGLATAVHCRAGLGRTGTMIACYLVHEGHSSEEALNLLRVHRPGSVETESQEQAVREFARSSNALGQRA